jgi:arsenate reductase
MEPWDLARPRESRAAGFADLPRDSSHRTDWVDSLAAHPQCIQRPIILLDDGTAVVARDAETLDRILG